jgi:hypothetical protein
MIADRALSLLNAETYVFAATLSGDGVDIKLTLVIVSSFSSLFCKEDIRSHVISRIFSFKFA